MDNTYLLYKSLHILGVILFVGNIIITGWWKVMADRTRHPAIIAYAQRQVTLTDFVFTAGGSALVLLTGIANAQVMGVVVKNHIAVDLTTLTVRWLANGYWLFVLSGILWVLVLIPVQIKQARMARTFAEGSPIPALYWKLCRVWLWVGALATILPLGNLYWMVFKPA